LSSKGDEYNNIESEILLKTFLKPCMIRSCMVDLKRHLNVLADKCGDILDTLRSLDMFPGDTIKKVRKLQVAANDFKREM